MLGSARRKDGALTIQDPSGKSLKIPFWMVSPAAEGMNISSQAKICAPALVSLLELIDLHFCSLGADLPSVKNDPLISDESTREGGSHEAAFVGRSRRASRKKAKDSPQRKVPR